MSWFLSSFFFLFVYYFVCGAVVAVAWCVPLFLFLFLFFALPFPARFCLATARLKSTCRFPYPRMGVAALSPPTANSTSWCEMSVAVSGDSPLFVLCCHNFVCPVVSEQGQKESSNRRHPLPVFVWCDLLSLASVCLCLWLCHNFVCPW